MGAGQADFTPRKAYTEVEENLLLGVGGEGHDVLK